MPRRTVVNVAHPGLERTHIGINRLIGKIHGYVIILVGVPDIKQNRFVKVFDIYQRVQFFPRIAIRPVSSCRQPDIFARHQFLDNVSAAVVKLAGVHAVARVVVRQGISPDEKVSRCQPGISRYVIKIGPAAPQFDARFGVADIEIRAGRAHDAERPGGHHVYFFGGLFDAFFFSDADYFFSRKNDGFTSFDFLVDFRDSFCQFNIIPFLPE